MRRTAPLVMRLLHRGEATASHVKPSATACVHAAAAAGVSRDDTRRAWAEMAVRFARQAGSRRGCQPEQLCRPSTTPISCSSPAEECSGAERKRRRRLTRKAVRARARSPKLWVEVLLTPPPARGATGVGDTGAGVSTCIAAACGSTGRDRISSRRGDEAVDVMSVSAPHIGPGELHDVQSSLPTARPRFSYLTTGTGPQRRQKLAGSVC